jgi:hypothetical protein
MFKISSAESALSGFRHDPPFFCKVNQCNFAIKDGNFALSGQGERTAGTAKTLFYEWSRKLLNCA